MKDGIHVLDNTGEPMPMWNRFIFENLSATFYHQLEWKLVNQREFGHETRYLASIDEGQVNGVLPLVLIRSRLFGNTLSSLPFVNFCGPFAKSPEIEKALLAYAYEIARQEDVDYLELRSLNLCDRELLVSKDKVSLTVSLAESSEQLWDGFTSKHRNNIRRAYKSGLRVEQGQLELLDTFYDLLSRNWRDLGTPIYRKRFFRTILETFNSQTRIFVVYHGETPVATALNGYFQKTVEGMWAGSPFQYRRLQSNYVLYWEMIKSACDEGYCEFHLGRSSVDSGGEAFKKKWGGVIKQLYWQYYLPRGGNIPQLNVNNPKYSIAIAAWRKMPLWLTKAIGPTIARSIP